MREHKNLDKTYDSGNEKKFVYKNHKKTYRKLWKTGFCNLNFLENKIETKTCGYQIT